jgi:hypothetical protein
VPVALNTDALPDSAVGRFFRELMRQWPQGLWVVSPEGKTLAHHYHKPLPGESYSAGQDRWLRETLALIDTGLKGFGEVPKRNPGKVDALADRGTGFAKEGGVRLAVSVVGFQKGRREGPPAVDHVRLTKDEWTSFAPPDGKDGWKIPNDLAAKFAPALSPLTDSIFVPKPGDVSKAELAAKVVRRTGDVAIVRYAGCWEAKHFRDGDPRFPIRSTAAGDGVAVFDLKEKTIREVVWVLRGSYDNSTAWGTAAVVEWSEKAHR